MSIEGCLTFLSILFGFQEVTDAPQSWDSLACLAIFQCFCIDRYEASRPTATSDSSGWPGYGAPDNGIPQVIPGVLPWQINNGYNG